MSAVDEILVARVEELSRENQALKYQNEHLAKLLAESLGTLEDFNRSANDKLRHYTLAKDRKGKYDWRKLLHR